MVLRSSHNPTTLIALRKGVHFELGSSGIVSRFLLSNHPLTFFLIHTIKKGKERKNKIKTRRANVQTILIRQTYGTSLKLYLLHIINDHERFGCFVQHYIRMTALVLDFS